MCYHSKGEYMEQALRIALHSSIDICLYCLWNRGKKQGIFFHVKQVTTKVVVLKAQKSFNEFSICRDLYNLAVTSDNI